MEKSLQADLGRLRRLAFKRHKRCGAILRGYHKMRSAIDAHEHARSLWTLYHWLLVPLSLWPVDVAGLAEHVLTHVKKQRSFDTELALLLETLGPAPARDACDVMGEYEHKVAKGDYDGLVRCHEKFDERERLVGRMEEFRKSWRKVRQSFDVAKYRLKRGVIRRQMSQERNFRERLTFSWQTEEARFRQVFDALCYRWNLYGVKNGKPLLLKITVNPTPHGTMIFIPRYWSLALSRDFNGNEIARLHHAHGAIRGRREQIYNSSIARMVKSDPQLRCRATF